jgi:hypothetical protein
MRMGAVVSVKGGGLVVGKGPGLQPQPQPRFSLPVQLLLGNLTGHVNHLKKLQREWRRRQIQEFELGALRRARERKRASKERRKQAVLDAGQEYDTDDDDDSDDDEEEDDDEGGKLTGWRKAEAALRSDLQSRLLQSKMRHPYRPHPSDSCITVMRTAPVACKASAAESCVGKAEGAGLAGRNWRMDGMDGLEAWDEGLHMVHNRSWHNADAARTFITPRSPSRSNSRAHIASATATATAIGMPAPMGTGMGMVMDTGTVGEPAGHGQQHAAAAGGAAAVSLPPCGCFDMTKSVGASARGRAAALSELVQKLEGESADGQHGHGRASARSGGTSVSSEGGAATGMTAGAADADHDAAAAAAVTAAAAAALLLSSRAGAHNHGRGLDKLGLASSRRSILLHTQRACPPPTPVGRE